MTTFNEGDRVEMIVNPRMTGVVTGDKDTVFTSFICVRWDSGDFARVNPGYLQHVEASTYERDMAALDHAQRLAVITLDRLEAEVGIVFAGNHNRAESDAPDWQARAEQAEAKVAKMLERARLVEESSRPMEFLKPWGPDGPTVVVDHRFLNGPKIAALEADQ